MEDGPADLHGDHRGLRVDTSIPESINSYQASTMDWTTDFRVFLQKQNRQTFPGKLARCQTPSRSTSNDDNVSVHSYAPVPSSVLSHPQSVLRRSQKILKPFCVVSA
jgi:hypothetical protein